MDDGRRRGRRRPERAMQDLVGSGPTQISAAQAARARDADRPSDHELAEAERDLVIVRRHWQPPDQDSTAPVRS